MVVVIRNVAVLGAGTMGHGIAEAAALAGYPVTIYDVQQRFLDGAIEKIEWSLSKLTEKGVLTRDGREGALGRIHATLDLREVASADLIVEAVPEELTLKTTLFQELGKDNERSIFASNTSTIPITEIAKSVPRPQRFVGIHFFNPPVLMPLVEITRGDLTDQATLEAATAFAKSLGKQVVLCSKDVPGFIVNRILGPMINEAGWIVSRGQAQIEQLDSAAVHKLGLPMGVFELADYTGIDVIHKAHEIMTSREPSTIPIAPLIEQKFREGKLGKKTGEGFYRYDETSPRPQFSKETGQDIDPILFLSVAVNAAAWLIRNQVCSKDDLDLSVKLGLGFPDGLLRMSDRWGIDRVVASLKEKQSAYGPQYSPDPLLEEMVSRGEIGVASGMGFYEHSKTENAFEELVLTKSPPLAWISLNRPHKLNTITPKMTEELEAAATEVAADGSIRVVVLVGAGEKAFSAGADLASFGFGSQGKAFEASRRMYEVFSSFEKMPKPVVAAIKGFAFGGGCELALACDFRLASESSQIGLTETSLGIMPGAGGTQRLPRLIGLGKAREMIYFGSRLSAADALKVGLVDRVFPDQEFRSAVEEFANRLAKRAPLSLRFAKQALNVAASSQTDLGQLIEAQSFALLLSTQDASEGITAFLSKKEPEFKGE